ncbi:MAG: virB8 family protein [Gammaproteobacteria bacterium]
MSKTSYNSYFKAANDWSYDRYESQLVIANRWQLAFAVQALICVLLAILLIILFPLKEIAPIIIHENQTTHETWVEPATNKRALNVSRAALESDLVRYVIARETYAVADRQYRFRQVMLRSNVTVFNAYRKQNDPANPHSLVAQLKLSGTRTVKIQDVILLNTDDPQQQLAKIDFVTTSLLQGKQQQQHWVATIKWQYRGIPREKLLAWENWNGFIVVYYRVDQRNV